MPKALVQSLKLGILAMVDVEWVDNGLMTIERIDRNTKMEYYFLKSIHKVNFRIFQIYSSGVNETP